MAADLQGRFYSCEIYKSNTTQALQLLEFLIKNGSERVIDDARAHTSLLKMLRQFHFIDANGKDQGINVRNRSKELVDLLSDVDKIRTERKKAKGNRAKYGGYEGGGAGGSGGDSSSGGRYGGFGSESAGYGAYDGRVYGDGGGFGGQTSEYQDSQARRDQFEEYDEFEEAAPAGKSRRKASTSSPTSRRESKKPEPKAKVPEDDLFDFGDEPVTVSSSKPSGSALGSLQPADEEDDFDDFQSAPVQPSFREGGHPAAHLGRHRQFAVFSPIGRLLHDVTHHEHEPGQPDRRHHPLAGPVPRAVPGPAAADGVPAGPAQLLHVGADGRGAAGPGRRPPGRVHDARRARQAGRVRGARPRGGGAGGDAFAGLLAGTPSAKRDAGAGGGQAVHGGPGEAEDERRHLGRRRRGGSGRRGGGGSEGAAEDGWRVGRSARAVRWLDMESGGSWQSFAVWEFEYQISLAK